MNIPTEKTIQTGCVISKMVILLGESLDYASKNDYEISFVSGYSPIQLPDDPWRVKAYENWTVVSLCYQQASNLRCVLSREGKVRLYGPGGKPDYTYQIPEAGVFGNTAVGLGYVNRIRSIDNHLYVCGQSRQVYRFHWDGQDFASGRWHDVAGVMRQPPMPAPPGNAEEEDFNRWLDDNDAIDLVDIDGPSENDIYVVGDECWHWNGSHWRQLALPVDEPISAIKALSPELIFFAGHNGSLLVGNARSGFRDLSSIDDNQNFVSIEWFANKLFLTSNLGLFTYDPRHAQITPYRTNLTPDLRDTHILEAKDGVLWSFGFKDLAWFDGESWTRVAHPENPPIR